MIASASPAALRSWLADGEELALVDVREAGQFGAAHLFSAIPLPYSRLELDIGALVPNPSVRIVLCDEGDGIAVRAANRLAAMGYSNVHRLDGGPPEWRHAGFPLFEGVNTVSKTFGEIVEHHYRTPRISPAALRERIARGDDILVLDGRPLSEFRKMNIPGAVCCPNGELALRVGTLAPNSSTTVVVNCAGRTRSIIGAQSLISLGIPNPVYALENGTQGWFLADLPLEHGAARTYEDRELPERAAAELRARTRHLMDRHGVPQIAADIANAWLADASRTTYLFDVRSAAEFARDGIPGSVHAPGGQLLQATDKWIGVRGARVVLLDQDGVRAGVIAMWLRAMGHAAVVLGRGEERAIQDRRRTPAAQLPALERVDFATIGGTPLVDLRESRAYRAGHAAGATWSTRPRVHEAARGARSVALFADDPGVAALAAIDLREAGVDRVVLVADAPLTVASPEIPSDADSIDFVFFAHARHDGDRAAAQQYLRWETELLAQLTDTERALFALGDHGPGGDVARTSA